MSDKLFFYSKSRDLPVGKGVNEIATDDYSDLNKIKDWRKMLSNFHVSPFKYGNYTYNSIEHVFQSEKIRLVDSNKAFLFTMESGNPIGLGDGAIAQKNRKLVMLKKEDLEKWETLKNQIMKDAAMAKYQQCPEAMKMLKATKNAELWHIVSRSLPVRFTHLEDIRKIEI